jgi:photosystem II stability/assembly factor-like uncharacterized protein
MSARLLVSTRKGLFTFLREAGRWAVERVSFLGQNVTLTHAGPAGWHAALNLGHFGVKLHHSTDEGRSWEERAVPAYPEGEMVVTGDGKPHRPASLQMIWSLEKGEHPEQLWAGTLPGGLFRSDDAGRSWSLNRPLWDHPERHQWCGGGYDWPGIHSLCVDPRSPRTVRLAVSTGGVWTSHDAGASWRNVGTGLFAEYMPPELRHVLNIQDVHRMAQSPSSPERVWVQHHNGVFRSDDGGETFTNLPDVPPSVFGFAVAVHPLDPDTAWFAPAQKDEVRVPVGGRVVVARTRDGGKSFTAITEGLPQEHAYDLVYRHGLAVDSSGSTLALGSTTGGLWVSEDEGSSWRPVPARLPPVHAVCFA